MSRSGRPDVGEYAAYAGPDIDRVAGDDIVEILGRQGAEVIGTLQPLDDRTVSGVRHAPGKWTVKEVLGHLADDERIFAYRALCIARGDDRPLAGFDEQLYARNAGYERRALRDVLDEYRAVRTASIALFAGFDEAAWLRRGVVNGYAASARGLAFHIAGHELHHLRALRDRYLPGLGG